MIQSISRIKRMIKIYSQRDNIHVNKFSSGIFFYMTTLQICKQGKIIKRKDKLTNMSDSK